VGRLSVDGAARFLVVEVFIVAVLLPDRKVDGLC